MCVAQWLSHIYTVNMRFSDRLAKTLLWPNQKTDRRIWEIHVKYNIGHIKLQGKEVNTLFLGCTRSSAGFLMLTTEVSPASHLWPTIRIPCQRQPTNHKCMQCRQTGITRCNSIHTLACKHFRYGGNDRVIHVYTRQIHKAPSSSLYEYFFCEKKISILKSQLKSSYDCEYVIFLIKDKGMIKFYQQWATETMNMLLLFINNVPMVCGHLSGPSHG